MAGDRRGVRHGLLGAVTLILVGILGTRLWFLQVVDTEAIADRVEVLSTREVDLPPERGRIFDADGRVLADNRRVLTVTVEQDVIRTRTAREALFARLAGPLKTSQELLEEKYLTNPDPPVLPFAAARDVSEETAIFLQERVEDYPGVDIREDWERIYLYAPIASQIIGYMGAVPADDESTPDVNETKVYTDAGYNANEKVGASGIEKSFEQALRGSPGRAVYEVDGVGRVLAVKSYVPPVPGQDVQLTIDLDIQQFAEQALETQLRSRRIITPYRDPTDPKHYSIFFKAPAGAVVVQEHGTGRVIAMASYPTFDNRWFSAGISKAKFQQLFPPDSTYEGIPFDQRPASPLVNRAIQGRYNVGSTFKPFTAYAAVHYTFPTDVMLGDIPGPRGGEAFIPNPLTDTYDDTGKYEIPSGFCNKAEGVRCEFKNAFNFTTGAPTVYGAVTLSDALTVSSDAFFYRIGAELFLAGGGTAVLQEEVKKFGFGQKTGIDLPYEYRGIVPDAEIKKKLADQGAISEAEGRGFFVGDSVQMAIGQGLSAITPLQLNNAYATFANGGFLLRPLIVRAIYAPGVPDSELPGFAKTEGWDVIKEYAPEVRSGVELIPEKTFPIFEGLHRVINGPHANFKNPTAVAVFQGYSIGATLAGKTGTAQGFGNLAENDSSVFAAFEQNRQADGYTVTAYLEKAGYGKQAAAPVVRCVFQALRGEVQTDPIELSDQLDINQPVPALPNLLRDPNCVKGDTDSSQAER